MISDDALINRSATLLAKLSAERPLVHNVTNFVAMDLAANTLLALGASPVMAHAREEMADLAERARALSINSGTLSEGWVEAALAAARAYGALSKPWVYDPVGVGATRFRQETAAKLVALGPTVIRGNAAEILTLADNTRAVGRGVDASGGEGDVGVEALTLAHKTGAVVVATGPFDIVSDGKRIIRLSGGHALMPRVTAVGCALTATLAAFLAVADDPLEASVAALAVFAAAGALAGKKAAGPGSFRVAFLDALYTLQPQDLTQGVKIL